MGTVSHSLDSVYVLTSFYQPFTSLLTFSHRPLTSFQRLSSPRPPRPYIPSYEERKLLNRSKDDAIERRIRGPKRVPLPSSLPPEDEKRVNAILNQRGVVSKYAREQVTDADLSRLWPCQWLNDEIVNFYGALILGRSEGSKENPSVNHPKANGVTHSKRKPLNVHYFSTFFWSKLKGEGYEKGRLAKWTKKVTSTSKNPFTLRVR
jgi:sentrin-specific protease 1